MKKKKNYIWQITLEDYFEVIKLAKKHGKKTGDSMQEELEEYLKNKKHNIKLIGKTDMDIDLLTGNLRENGLKVLNIKEIKDDKDKK